MESSGPSDGSVARRWRKRDRDSDGNANEQRERTERNSNKCKCCWRHCYSFRRASRGDAPKRLHAGAKLKHNTTHACWPEPWQPAASGSTSADFGPCWPFAPRRRCRRQSSGGAWRERAPRSRRATMVCAGAESASHRSHLIEPEFVCANAPPSQRKNVKAGRKKTSTRRAGSLGDDRSMAVRCSSQRAPVFNRTTRGASARSRHQDARSRPRLRQLASETARTEAETEMKRKRESEVGTGVEFVISFGRVFRLHIHNKWPSRRGRAAKSCVSFIRKLASYTMRTETNERASRERERETCASIVATCCRFPGPTCHIPPGGPWRECVAQLRAHTSSGAVSRCRRDGAAGQN